MDENTAKLKWARGRAAVAAYLQATDQDLCHELRRELADVFGLDAGDPQTGTAEAFGLSCDAYQRKLFGTCRTDELRNTIGQLQSRVRELESQLASSVAPASA